jgi:Aminoglycoside adenylyltransferase, C-terminal domain
MDPVVLDDLVEQIQSALGDSLVGIYLYGSAITGGFDEGVSDLDLVAITAPEVDRLDLTGLERMHAAFVAAHPLWTDRIEVAYIGRDTLASFRTSTGRLAVISPGEPFHLKDDRAVEWVQNWYLVREGGVTLFGPPADSLIPSISWSEFVEAARRYVTELASSGLEDFSPGYLAYAVLTMSRAEHTIVTHARASKQVSAEWAQARHPEWAPLIGAALRCRTSGGRVGFDDPATRSDAVRFIRTMSAEADTWSPSSIALPAPVRQVDGP